ncbi:hypothetical protein B0T25DRAFT_529588 [Lasiosphaeria hispida]|uniref:Kinesin light chain n=1 Tax=Lasiosphaeria hispida TaxID=260671 RepID=A0AAJ0MKV8_9PEZI|nr:hypothetical protein B0T25DRAFT_529588 [Lasiosphaeria hispida]
MASLAVTLWNQGRWEEAEKLEVQVMETSKTKLGANHPDTLSSMANLAFTWKGQGRHADALALMEDCAQARRRVIGEEHPYTLSSLAAVADWRGEEEGGDGVDGGVGEGRDVDVGAGAGGGDAEAVDGAVRGVLRGVGHVDEGQS